MEATPGTYQNHRAKLIIMDYTLTIKEVPEEVSGLMWVNMQKYFATMFPTLEFQVNHNITINYIEATRKNIHTEVGQMIGAAISIDMMRQIDESGLKSPDY